MMASAVENANKEDGIRAFEEVMEKVRQRYDRPTQHPDPSVIPPRMHDSETPLTTDVDCPSELVSTSNSSSIDHPLIPPVSGHYDSNRPGNIPTHLSLSSAHSIHSTEAATFVNRTMSPFPHHLSSDVKQQLQFSTYDPYGMYPEPVMIRNIQSRPTFTGDSAFQRQMIYHTMQPRNNIRSSPSAISSPLIFSEINHHVETRTGRSPDCQSTSDSSLQGDTGTGPLPDERKARNRVAAMKCRAKKLEQIRRLEKRVTDLRNQNMDLQRQVISLRGEIQSLHYVCLQHRNSGCRI